LLAEDLAKLAKEGAFSGKVSTDLCQRVTTFLTITLANFVKVRYITLDFIQVAVFERLVSLLSSKDFHQHVIPLLIQLNEITLIPFY
jgi:hypothetical protein